MALTKTAQGFLIRCGAPCVRTLVFSPRIMRTVRGLVRHGFAEAEIDTEAEVWVVRLTPAGLAEAARLSALAAR